MLQYNFVLYFSEKDYNKIVYSDFDEMPNVQIYHGFKPQNNILKKIHFIHNSEKINSRFRLPLKSIWFKSYLNTTISQKNNKPLCFVFMFVWIHRSFVQEYILYLRKRYPDAKFVCYYTDIVSTLEKTPTEISHLFDLLITYDKNDAQQFNMLYFPTSFSDIKICNNSGIERCDVLFLGKAKDRLDKIYSVYRKLNKAFVKCNFYLVGVPQEKRREGVGLYYLDKPMDYYTYLQHVKQCRCILEIEQRGAVGETLRNWEAINFGKALLTDNPGIQESDFYDKKYIREIDEDGGIDLDFIRSYKEYDNPLRDEIRPIKLLEFIQNHL